MPQEVIRVRISEFRVAAEPALLKISGLGSCVALALYDEERKVGGLAHILLPGPDPEAAGDKKEPARNSSKYAGAIIRELVGAMTRAQCRVECIKAKIAGGANMFLSLDKEEADSFARPGVGERNVAVVRRHLKRLSIKIQGEDVGGSTGRTITFETQTGKLTVTDHQGKSKKF